MEGAILLVVLLAVLLALLIAARGGAARSAAALITGGAVSPRSRAAEHIRSPRARARAARSDVVVDTLNLTHHLMCDGALGEDGEGSISQCAITAAIRHSAPLLKEYFPGRVLFVIKDRDSLPNTPRTRALYAALARDAKVHIHIVERPDPSMYGTANRASWHATGHTDPSHQQKGRDDFYVGLMAWKMNCGALTEDRMRDFNELKLEVAPFVVHEISPWSVQPPVRNHVNPGAREYARIRAPTRLNFRDYGL
jgi:hypothetical protein